VHPSGEASREQLPEPAPGPSRALFLCAAKAPGAGAAAQDGELPGSRARGRGVLLRSASKTLGRSVAPWEATRAAPTVMRDAMSLL